ncbi:MAG: CapA family protein [Clostridium sp.]|nr:CapA family protein [Acetatifactor muris]MCM1525762.1 CapA family protein [Bacteroides sp.]MCM1564084.1 CapA family protein [Clostridium sp.]
MNAIRHFWEKTVRRAAIGLVLICGFAMLWGCAKDTENIPPTIQSIAPEEHPEPPKFSDSEPLETTATDERETVEDEREIVTITVTAAGDVTMGNYVGQDYAWSFRQMYDTVEDKSYFFENVYDIFSEDDMTIVNLEGVLTFSEELNEGRTYNIKGDPEYANILTYGSVEAVSMANNHRLDFGENGTKDTLEALEPTGIVYAYDNKVGIYEVKGIRIGFVSVNEIGWGQGIEQLMKNGIAKLQEEGVDLILACCHWGIEREYYPTEYQQQFGKQCIDWGADLVIGHHPHVLQGVEEYQGKYIIYSLANFCFGANRNPADKDTMIAQQTFTFIDGEKQEETEFRIIPCSITSDPSRNDYRPTPAQDEEAERIIGRINEYSQAFGLQFDEEGYIRSE